MSKNNEALEAPSSHPNQVSADVIADLKLVSEVFQKIEMQPSVTFSSSLKGNSSRLHFVWNLSVPK